MIGLYIHIPFCQKVCDYCDFQVLKANENYYDDFTEALILELSFLKARYPEKWNATETLYFGGGTPSVLPLENLKRIFLALKNSGIDFGKLKEITMEMNPESVTEEKLQLAIDSGIKRFSLGIQTFDENILKKIGRTHSVKQAYKALDLLCSEREIHVNADLMFNLPDQSVFSFEEDVLRLSEYPVKHISFYGLQISKRTMLYANLKKNLFSVDENLYADMYKTGVSLLEKKGFYRYEVSNFAKPGFESLHNLNYWNRGEYFGAGPSAHAFLDDTRFHFPGRYSAWKKWVASGASVSEYEKEFLTKKEAKEEFIWLSLRQKKGLSLKELYEKYQAKTDPEKITFWEQKKCIAIENDRLFLINDGWIFMDSIVLDFF